MDRKIKDIMIRPNLIGADSTFIEVLTKMICAHTNSLLVINKRGVLVGRVQSLNLLWHIKPDYIDDKFAALTAHFIDEESFQEFCIKAKDDPLEEFMEKDPKTVKVNTSIMEAAMIAIEDKHARIPVVDDENKPIGILTRTELKKIMASYFGISECPESCVHTQDVALSDGKPLTTLLLPLAGNEIDKRIVKFAGCLASSVDESIQNITMLHVTGEGFLKRYLEKITTRRIKGEIVESKIFDSEKNLQITNVVKPMLDKTAATLTEYGVKCPIRQKIVDGDYSQQILHVANDGCYSTIVMGRKSQTLIADIFSGSVSSELLHSSFQGTIYIVGERFDSAGSCPAAKILVPIDGSANANAALIEAATLASQYEPSLASVTLINVINISKNPTQTVEATQEAEAVLNKGKQVIVDAGIDESKIDMRIHHGVPADAILAVSLEIDANIIMIGRRGLSTMSELLMGSVSSAVLHRCGNSTIAIVASSTK